MRVKDSYQYKNYQGHNQKIELNLTMKQ